MQQECSDVGSTFSSDRFYTLTVPWWSRDSAIGVRFRVPEGSEFSLLHVVQTVSGAHHISFSMGTGDSFPEVNRRGREADHSPPTSFEVIKTWTYTSTPPYAFIQDERQLFSFLGRINLQTILILFTVHRSQIRCVCVFMWRCN
jgi:hypothetical protein